MVNLALVLLCFAQGSPASLPKQGELTQQISDLKSEDVQARMDAYAKIKGNSGALKRPDVKAALVDLLDRENHLVARTNAAGFGMDEKYGEGYGEYLDALIDTVAQRANWQDPYQVCVLAQGSYNSASIVPFKLATESGTVAIPCLMKMARGSFYDRQSSLPVLVQLSTAKNNLDPDARRQIKQSILTWLKDPDSSIRMIVAYALGRFGGPDVIPVLENLAHSDPESSLVNGKTVFDVRVAAVSAIHSIQARAKAH